MPPAVEEAAVIVATLPSGLEIPSDTTLSTEMSSSSLSDVPPNAVPPSEIVELSSPDRPLVLGDTANAMDTSTDTPSVTAVDAQETLLSPESTPQDTPTESASSPAASSLESSTESSPEAIAPPPPPPPPPQDPQEGEHVTPAEVEEEDEEEAADWADIEEDLSAPDEAELKEIEAAEGDYSAHECKMESHILELRSK